MATFTLSRASFAQEWQVIADNQPVLSFREGLLAYTKEVQNPELEAEALAWLEAEYDITDCYIDARRHLLWNINCEWKWQILVAALRYGISIDDEDDNLAYMEGRLDKEDELHYLAYTVENYDIEQLDLDLDEDIDKSDLVADLDFMTVDEMEELYSILASFDINRNEDEQSMPDSVLADLVVRDWAQDLLWWPALLDSITPRQMMGNTIAHIRMRHGMTQEQLADAAGITAANVRNIEAGKYNVNIDVLSKIANALGDDLVITSEPEE